MASAPTFEQILARTPQNAPAAPDERAPAWRSWESWVTFALVVFVQLPVVGSLQSSEWVREMPNLMVPALTGLLLAWTVGHSRLGGLASAAIAVATGAVLVVGMVMHTMVLALPTSSGLIGRWYELRLRLLEWGKALVGEGISADPLPFVVMLVSAVFLVGFVSTWAVVRWRNPWAALVPGGFVLLTNISYLPGQPSFSFVLFLVAAVMLVARLTFLQSVTVWRSQGVAPREGMSLEVLFVGAVVASALIVAAWVIPTANNFGPAADLWGRAFSPVADRVDVIGRLFIGVGSKKPIPVHAMDAVLPLQGRVGLDEVELYEIVAPEEMNLRGAVYDEYTGSGWRVSSASAVPLVGTTVEAAQLGTPSSRAQVREAIRIDITVLDESAPGNVLLAAGDPIASDQDASLIVDVVGGPLQLRPGAQAREGDTYSTVGTRSAAAEDTLATAGTVYPADVIERYLALPDDVPPEVGDLARSIAGNATSPYEAARLVESYLRQNYTFSFDIAAPPAGRDAVAHFLFESRTGYFDLYASSMAVLLRELGVPTRVAVGFALDDAGYDATSKSYRVTEEQAWTWPEVYFPGLGWVEFNPTPSRDLLVRPGDDSEARAAAASEFDDLPFSDDELFAEVTSGGVPADLEFTTAEEGESALVGFIARLIGWALVAATVLLVVVVGVRLLWNRIFRDLDAPARRWAKVQLLAAVAGLAPAPDRTPAEVADDLAARIGRPEALTALARAYTRARYGGPEAGVETDEEAAALDGHYRAVRGLLWRRVLGRFRRLGRVEGGPLTRRRRAAEAAR
ncbi:MAG: DUF3488 and DUF4129 domain-containing transglutaminase family protein [Dehalococcoidia bacterium]